MTFEIRHVARFTRRSGEAGKAGDEDAVAKSDRAGSAGTGHRRFPDDIPVIAPIQRDAFCSAAAQGARPTKLRPVRDRAEAGPGRRPTNHQDQRQAKRFDLQAARNLEICFHS